MTWIQTHSNAVVDLDDPQPEQIKLWDIAWALGHLCRYTGHTDVFYSVAEHSMVVADIAKGINPALELAALLHDAEEAYVGDWSKPLKDLLKQVAPLALGVPLVVKAAIGQKFGVVLTPEDPIVKRADTVALLTEARDLLGPCERKWDLEWTKGAKPREQKTVPLGSPVKAATLFYDRVKRAGGR